MIIDTCRLIVDFGLLILIWMVQLLIYPSFGHYTHKNLVTWHTRYTRRLAFIVIPLMFTQVFIVGYQFYENQETYTYLSVVLVVSVWLSTFIQFVPLHTKISKGLEIEESVQKLIHRNWIRTALWTALFLLSVWDLFRPW